MDLDKLQNAYAAIDLYNSRDPHRELHNGEEYPKELLYGRRMTEGMNAFAPRASEALKIAARAQHIGRWEIPRNSYPMDRKGYLQWRSAEKFHHARIIEPILREAGYDIDTIEKVKFLLLKKELGSNPDTQALEDVICIVFLQYYLEEFASQHEDQKVVEILRKTIRKISSAGMDAVGRLNLSERVVNLLASATIVDEDGTQDT